MIRKIKWLLPVVFLVACNNDNKTGDGHTAHKMVVNGNNYCDSVNTGLKTEDTLKGSPFRSSMATIGDVSVHIEYSSPGVKGRIVWGGLVAYDKVWVTGAHKATSVQFSKEVEISGKKIPAGKYAFFTIPGKEKWIVILNTRFDQHLADEYNEKEDVLRLEVNPAEHAMAQRLTYAVNSVNDKSGEIVMQWEKLIIKIPFTTI